MAVAGPREHAVMSVIDCVAIFYEEGKGGENYRKKNKFRCRIDKEEKRLVKFRENICEFAGIKSTAKTLGLGDNLRVELNRETKKDGRTERISIETDQQLELELPPILTCCDKLQQQAEGPEENRTFLLNEKENDDEIADEFDSSSDEEVEAGDAEGGNSLLQGEIGSSATFLLGAQSRFGRVVRFNNRFLS